MNNKKALELLINDVIEVSERASSKLCNFKNFNKYEHYEVVLKCISENKNTFEQITAKLEELRNLVQQNSEQFSKSKDSVEIPVNQACSSQIQEPNESKDVLKLTLNQACSSNIQGLSTDSINTSVDTKIFINPENQNSSIKIKKKKLKKRFVFSKKSKKKKQTIEKTIKSKKFTIPRNINKKNHIGETYLHTACKKGKLNDVTNYLEAKADPNTKDNSDWTPLQESASFGFDEICKQLLIHGADVNARGFEQGTAIHEAIKYDKCNTVLVLIEYKANMNISDKHNKKPRDYCCSRKMGEILDSYEVPVSESQKSTASEDISIMNGSQLPVSPPSINDSFMDGIEMDIDASPSNVNSHNIIDNPTIENISQSTASQPSTFNSGESSNNINNFEEIDDCQNANSQLPTPPPSRTGSVDDDKNDMDCNSPKSSFNLSDGEIIVKSNNDTYSQDSEIIDVVGTDSDTEDNINGASNNNCNTLAGTKDTKKNEIEVICID